MSGTKITVKSNGSLKIEGDFQIVEDKKPETILSNGILFLL